MSFFGFMSSPVSIPPVFDTTPCLEHLMEYEDCVIDVGSEKKQLLMPAWSTLYPGLIDGVTNTVIDTRSKDMKFEADLRKDYSANQIALTSRQKQLLYECEEERMVFKACARELLKRKRHPKMASWQNAEISSMCLD